MRPAILEVLRCPLTKERMEIEIYQEEKRDYCGTLFPEIISGLLKSPCGYVYPIVNGVPRLQVESFLEHEEFIRTNNKSFDAIKNKIFSDFDYVIKQAIKRNRKTKLSFGKEWSIFKHSSDTTWGWNKETRKERFLKELNTASEELKGKKLIDIGCGNGVLTSGIAEFGMETFGIDVSLSVEQAFQNNKNPNVHYIQGDLQLPSFPTGYFDIVYSTGVIHHTNNTELSFSCISEIVKPKGILYVWLYRPEKDLKHNALNFARMFTNKLPLSVQYWIYFFFLVPQGLLKTWSKGTKRNWREQLINYFDVLSPEFRYEHTTKEVEGWYYKRNFYDLKVTIEEYLGFGIMGRRKE